jgi:N-acetylneuraminic acid mutarotase
MLSFRLWLLVMAVALAAPRIASAHFLWLVTQIDSTPAKVKVYFGETADPDDPDLLDRVLGAKVWVLPGRRSEPQLLSLKKGTDALEAELPAQGKSAPVVLRHAYGVVSRGDDTFLLNYYAKAYPFPLPGTWQAVSDNERVPLEVTPKMSGGELVLRVTWNGEPAKGATVTLHGPGVDKEGDVDDEGTFRCEVPEEGVCSIRARYIEETSGEHDGKPYTQSRHYSTLTLNYAPSQLAPVAHNLPDLPQGITSLGAAIAGDSLYLYGGNYGDAHEYSKDGQSGDLWKLDLRNPRQWEKLPGGPKLQGLALVEHKGQLYRVGGFTAMNEAGEDQDLRSQPDFARFDPEKQSWEQLPNLPEPRSSHDAAVMDGVLYVAGGWRLQGESAESKWHETAWKMDLNHQPLEWKPISSPPFKRRALAVAASGGKLYCLGGMQEEGGPTTAIAVYDPAKDSWAEGPSLLGGPMDGFGASAFACRGCLYATTITGSIQRLSADGKQWDYLGQLEHARFFHRIVPWNDAKLIVVGGGSMSVGKIQEVEVLPIAEFTSVAKRGGSK